MNTQDRGVQIVAFDYTPLSAPLRSDLRACAQRLSSLSKDAAVGLWEMGKVLEQAQKRLARRGNGTFTRWVEGEVGMNIRFAQRLIAVYKAFDRDKLSRTEISTSALYVLARTSTPPEARQEALRQAGQGQPITHAKAQQILSAYRPPPPPPKVELDPSPSAEYLVFEKTELMPRLHDAGDPDAPQVLSGQEHAIQAVPEARKEQARTSLRESIVEALRGVDTGDEAAMGACAGEILGILGQNSSISIAARFGVELERGPRTLSDLVSLAAWVCDVHLDDAERSEYLNWRKRVLRLIDAITCGGGVPIYEHVLENRQICYSLIPDPPDCP